MQSKSSSASSPDAVSQTADAKPRQQARLRLFNKILRPAMVLPLVGELSRTVWLVLAVAALAASILGAIFTHAPDIYESSAPKGFRNWAITPVEFHPEMQLANFGDLDIQAVAVAKDTAGRERLFVAGNNALLAFSDDRGRTWTRAIYDPLMGGFAVPGKRAPFPVTAPATSSSSGQSATQGSSSSTPPSNAPTGTARTTSRKRVPSYQQQSPAQRQINPPPKTAKPLPNSPAQSPVQKPINPRPSTAKPFAKSAAALFSLPTLVPSVFASDKRPAASPAISQTSGGSGLQGTSVSGADGVSGPPATSAGSAPALTPQPPPQGVAAICTRDDGALVLVMDWPQAAITSDFGGTWGARSFSSLRERSVGYSISLEQLRAGKVPGPAPRPNRWVDQEGVFPGVIGDTVISSANDLSHFSSDLKNVGSEYNRAFLLANGAVWALTYRSAQSSDNFPTGFIERLGPAESKWTEAFRTPGIVLHDIAFTADEATAFVVGQHGGIWRWQKLDNLWRPITRGALHPDQAANTAAADATYWRLPPPWTYPLMVLALGWFLVAVAISAVPGANTLREVAALVDSGTTPTDPAASVARISVSDRPLGEDDVDHLGFRAIARGVAGFLRNPKTQLPVTLAINGNWGSGKSSLMNLICGELRRARFRPIWFNAWHHQEDENLLASLLQSVRQEAPPAVLSRGGVPFRARLGWFRFYRFYPRALAMVAIFIGLWAAESWYDAPEKNNAPQLKLVFQEWAEKLQTPAPAPPSTMLPQNGAQAPPNPANSPSAGNSKASSSAGGSTKDKGTQPPDNMARNGSSPNQTTPPVHPLQSLLLTVLQLLASLHDFLDGATDNVGAKPLAALYLLLRIFPSALGRLKAFKTDPASLLHTAAPGVSKQQIEAQTSFRMRFAKEFSDVTKALGQSHRLVIFVDDLDRCRPGKVAEIMEAINYVTVSGDCAFILGIETHVVQAALALSFNAMAQELRFDGDSPSKVPAGALKVEESPEEKRLRRENFAKRYVEKLINIEMQVPDLDMRKKQAFFSVDEKSQLVPEYFATARRLAKTGRLLEPVAAFFLVIALGWSAGRGTVWYAEHRAGIHNQMQQEKRLSAAKEVSAAQQQAAAAASAEQTQQQASSPAPAPAPASTSETTLGQIPASLSGEQPLPKVFFQAPESWAFVLFFLAWAGRLLTREPVPPAKDSEKFSRALAAWGWVAGSGLNTPRATKRFLNRLRFLAMRQHPPSAQLPGLLKLMLSAKEQKRALELEAQPAAGGANTSAIPEDILVALASLEARDDNQPLKAGTIGTAISEVTSKAIDSATKGDPHAAAFLAELARSAGLVSQTSQAADDGKLARDLVASELKAGTLTLETAALSWGQKATPIISKHLDAYSQLQGQLQFT